MNALKGIRRYQQALLLLSAALPVGCAMDGTADSVDEQYTTESAHVVAEALAVGTNHTCALLTDGKTRCWGSDERGQLGNSSAAIESCSLPSGETLSCSPRPLQNAYDLVDAIELRVGAEHACATVGNEVRCWGSSAQGQTSDHNDRTFPGTVYGLN